jgi:excinuclease ABC subunit C
MKILKATKESIKNAPYTPGVYIFRDKNKLPIYVGKAKNLKSRLTSYFASPLESKTKAMINEAQTIKIIQTNTEIEALLLEANLVRNFQPFYNAQLKDDKSPLYIAITAEKYPRILTLRQTQLGTVPHKYLFGPYLNSRSPTKILKLLRRGFPYSDHKVGKRPCIRSHIGLCNPCPSYIENIKAGHPELAEGSRKQYLGNITKIRHILEGKLKITQRQLEKEMAIFSKQEKYEEAAKIKKQIDTLNYLTTPQQNPIEEYVKDPNLLEDIRSKEQNELKSILNKYLKIQTLNRIECYDVAHIAGTKPTASMVTFIGGEPDKTFYRHFKVNPKIKNNDFESMNSVLKRRIRYFDNLPTESESWGTPDLIIVDGGKPQVSAAVDIIGDKIPLVGLAKRDERLVFKINGKFEEIVLPKGHARNLVQRIRNEAHRFARRLHHNQVRASLLSN